MPSTHSRRAVLAAVGDLATTVAGCAGTPDADHSYEELSPEEQAVIDELRSSGSISRGIDDLPSFWDVHRLDRRGAVRGAYRA